MNYYYYNTIFCADTLLGGNILLQWAMYSAALHAYAIMHNIYHGTAILIIIIR